MIQLTRGAIGSQTTVAGQACMRTTVGQAGVVVYGPYEQRSAGTYRVQFSLGLDGGIDPLGDPVVAIVDVMVARGAARIAEKFILHSQLGETLSTHGLDFDLQEAREVEYRVTATGQAGLIVSETVEVEKRSEVAIASPPLSEQQRVWQNEREFLDGYLRNVDGLIHVGANIGQERLYYWLLGLDVIWVEPIREIYERLVDNISIYPRQKAVNALLTAHEGEQIEFRIANNLGASSSILELEDHRTLFPGIDYVELRTLTSTTFASMINRLALPLDRYQALTLDVEGAEKMVLEGAGDLLAQFEYIKCEVADFPARKGTPTVAELDAILTRQGFAQLSRREFTTGPGNRGTYWDIVWKKVRADAPLHEPGYPLPIVMRPDEVATVEKCE